MIRVRDLVADRRLLRRDDAPRRPEVSVVLPTFHRLAGGSLERAATSVLAQSRGDLELIVVDDGSTDGTFDFLQRLQAGDARVVIVRHDLNSGLPALRVNEGIELARGGRVAFQFDDDEWTPEALADLLAAASAAGDAAIPFGAAEVTFPDGRRSVPLPPVPLDEVLLSFENRIANSSVLVPRTAFDRVGMYDCHLSMRRLCDWDLWLRLARWYRFVPVDRIVARVVLEADERSLSRTVPFDAALFRCQQALARDAALRPASWHDYAVDDPAPMGLGLPGGLHRRLVDGHVEPFRRRLAAALRPAGAGEEGEAEDLPRTRPGVILWTTDAYYPPMPYFLSLYDRESAPRGGYRSYYQPLAQLDEAIADQADLLLLVRSTTPIGSAVLDRALAQGVPVGYFFDDDLLALHEQDPSWQRLAPGSRDAEACRDQLRRADAVWTNGHLARRIADLNRRTVINEAAVDEAMLPRELRPRPPRRKIGYVGGAYRQEEFALLWPAFASLARRFPGEVCFEFWGLDPGGLPELPAPLVWRPFEHGYAGFLERLRGAEFDVLVTPLLEQPPPRLAKMASKYPLTAVAGALGIFSDVPPYAELPAGLTCLKAANEVGAWERALEEALRMPAARFDGLRRAMVEHVRLEYSVAARLDGHEAACRAIELHARTRAWRGPDGRPRVLVVAPDGTPGARAAEVVEQLAGLGVAGVAGEGAAALGGAGEVALVHALGEVAGLEEACAAAGLGLFRDGAGVLVQQSAFARGLARILGRIAGEEESARDETRVRRLLAVPPGVGAAGDAGAGALTTALSGDGWEVSCRTAPECEEVFESDLVLAAEGSATAALAGAAGVPWIPWSEDRLETLRQPGGAMALAGAHGGLEARIAAYRAARAGHHPRAVQSRTLAAYLEAVVRTVPRPRPAEIVPREAGASPGGAPPEPRRGPGRERLARLRHRADRIGLYRPLSRLRWAFKRRRVVVAFDDDTVSTHLCYRSALPELEAATGRRWSVLPAAQVRPEDLYSVHALILQRAVSEQSLALLAAARREGCRTIYDADDNLLLIDQVIDDPAHPWRVYYGGARERIGRLLAGVDAIKVYSPAALPLFRRHNPSVSVIPPFHDPGEPPQADRRPGPVRVGFFGSYYKDADFAPLLGVIRELARGRPALSFQFFGFLPKALEGEPGVVRLPWERSYERFRAQLRALQWDVGLAPLRELDFNRCKTDNKYREYAAAGIAGVYSRAEIFRLAVRDGETGLLVPQEDAGAWREAILRLATDRELRAAVVARARADLVARYSRGAYVARVAELVG